MSDKPICAKCVHVDMHGSPQEHRFWSCAPKDEINYVSGKRVRCDCMSLNARGDCEYFKKKEPTS